MSQDEVVVGWNGKSVTARGVAVYAILAVLSVIGAILYSGNETKEAIRALAWASKQEHTALRLAQDRTSCILSLTVEERAAFRVRYQAGSFKLWCPWMED